jgi:CHAT domain-containing protein
VTPSSLSNLPFEAYQLPEDYAQRELLPLHFAFTPSFMFGSSYWPEKRQRKRERLLIIGYEGSDLPQADKEAALLCGLFGERATYLPGRDCTKKSVSEVLNEDFDYIHFICHGTYDFEHPGESSLYFRDLWTADAYRLRAYELRQFVRFKKRPVVTLSACSTALTADSRSNTWRGLPGSLLEVGARCIVGTRWPVADEASGALMSQFYELLLTTDQTPLQCFHMMQDKARTDGRMEEWACFGYLGLP